jgi:hypothetical protein
METQEKDITATGIILIFAMMCIIIKIISLSFLWTVLLPWHLVMLPAVAWFILLIFRTAENIRAEHHLDG